MVNEGIISYYRKTKELDIPDKIAKNILRYNYGCGEAFFGTTAIIQEALMDLKKQNVDFSQNDAPEKVFLETEAIKHKHNISNPFYQQNMSTYFFN